MIIALFSNIDRWQKYHGIFLPGINARAIEFYSLNLPAMCCLHVYQWGNNFVIS